MPLEGLNTLLPQPRGLLVCGPECKLSTAKQKVSLNNNPSEPARTFFDRFIADFWNQHRFIAPSSVQDTRGKTLGYDSRF